MSDFDNAVLADMIVDFINELLERDDYPEEIVSIKDGFEIETDIGSSFSFEIKGASKIAVARAYHNHIMCYFAYLLKWRKSVYKYILYKTGGGFWITKKDMLAIQKKYNSLKYWGEELEKKWPGCLGGSRTEALKKLCRDLGAVCEDLKLLNAKGTRLLYPTGVDIEEQISRFLIECKMKTALAIADDYKAAKPK